MTIFKCKMCGGDLDIQQGMTVCECEFCGTTQTIPSADDEKKTNLFNRATQLRRANEFDRAITVYEQLINEFPDESEAYWGLVLCKYGIEYVDDPLTYRKIPTCHRTSYESIFDDVNYKQAVERADSVARSVYEDEAKVISDIQKGILRIAKNEKPFDIFICYKETDELGNRTQDSVLAQDLYYQLTESEFKVFFSRITLEGKLGTQYEPYIFAALNSAKVMVVVGTKPEYYNAVWLKNEWSRFLALMKQDKNKIIIPAYRDMDPYDLPDALSMFQAQDMSKLGFMQDLIRGIKKILHNDEEEVLSKNSAQETSINPKIDNLLKRGMLSLEAGNIEEANKFFERILDEDAEEARAYFGKLMIDLNYKTENDFDKGRNILTDNKNYRKILKFGDKEFISKVKEYNKQAVYNTAIYYKNDTDGQTETRQREIYLKAKKMFLQIPKYRDSEAQAEECDYLAAECIYKKAVELLDNAKTKSDCVEVSELLMKIEGFKDTSDLLKKCIALDKNIEYEKKYKDVIIKIKKAEHCESAIEAIDLYNEALKIAKNIDKNFKDIEEQKNNCIQKIEALSQEAAIESENKAKQAEEKHKKKRYEEAEEALAKSDYDAAIEIFSEIKEYRDSKSRIKYAEINKIGDKVFKTIKSFKTPIAIIILTIILYFVAKQDIVASIILGVIGSQILKFVFFYYYYILRRKGSFRMWMRNCCYCCYIGNCL